MSVEVITREDLQIFRQNLLNDIKSLLGKSGPQVKEWLKAVEVRKLLNISSGTLSTLRVTRKLRYSKIGGTYYYRYQDIQKMLTDANNEYE